MTIKNATMGQRMAILCQVGMVETNYLMKLMYFGLNLFNVILHNCQRWDLKTPKEDDHYGVRIVGKKVVLGTKSLSKNLEKHLNKNKIKVEIIIYWLYN